LIIDRIYFSGINYTAEHRDVHYGQIPGEPPFYVGDIELNDRAEREAYLVTQRYIQRGYLLTGDRFYGTAKEVNETLTRHYLLEEGMRAYDNSSGGIALACHQKKVPTINIRAVALEIGNPDQRLNWRRKGLEAMPTIGKIITRIVLEGGNEEG
jgi:nucleoside phosphorylase